MLIQHYWSCSYMNFNSETLAMHFSEFQLSSDCLYLHYHNNFNGFICGPLRFCVGSVKMVMVQHFIPMHWSARRARDMVLVRFCISPLQLHQLQFYTSFLLFSVSVLLITVNTCQEQMNWRNFHTGCWKWCKHIVHGLWNPDCISFQNFPSV